MIEILGLTKAYGALPALNGISMTVPAGETVVRWLPPLNVTDAEVDEADPEYGFFSPNSWWPLVLGFSTMVIVFGLIFAVWLIVLGVFILFIALIGWMFEYYRGAFAH